MLYNTISFLALSLNGEESLQKLNNSRIWIFTKVELICPCQKPNLSTKFRPNLSSTFWHILLTDRQTDGWKQPPSAFGCGGNELLIDLFEISYLATFSHCFSMCGVITNVEFSDEHTKQFLYKIIVLRRSDCAYYCAYEYPTLSYHFDRVWLTRLTWEL